MLNFFVEGEGKTIVFLHGFMESISMWDYLPLEKFAFQKIFIDLPGHGKSDLNPTVVKPSLQYFVDEVRLILNQLNVKSFSVVGHSMGGYVALELKRQLVECEKVILLNSNFWSDSEEKKRDRIRIADIAFKAKRIFIQESIPNLFANPENRKKEIEELKSEAMQMSSEAIAYASLTMRERGDFSTEFNSNPKDYYLIHGIQDRLLQTSVIKSKIQHKEQLFLIQNAGHMAHIEDSNKVYEILNLIFQ